MPFGRTTGLICSNEAIAIHLFHLIDLKLYHSHVLTDAHLLTINTKEENDFVLKYMSENPLITRRIWLGMDLDKQGKVKENNIDVMH